MIVRADSDDDNRLFRIAGDVADGQEVDWDTAEEHRIQ